MICSLWKKIKNIFYPTLHTYIQTYVYLILPAMSQIPLRLLVSKAHYLFDHPKTTSDEDYWEDVQNIAVSMWF